MHYPIGKDIIYANSVQQKIFFNSLRILTDR
ncbi:uncharacterized protein METZ01_LOCUS490444 [marine metagenome]|uniref:Uncharacterized protein n=1 Tax=marine metagenome TaxID=408172 RepID=A0A383CZV8_9ZZZZ